MEKKNYQLKIDGRVIEAEFSNLVEQSNGSVMVRMGDTVVLASAVMGKEDKMDLDYFPLLVNYEEKYYAAGKIYGSRFVRRESRPSDNAILTSRLIDRTIRPLFPSQMRRDVQVVITCLSIDEENDPDILGIIAASLALGVSNIPWNGPVAAVRVAWSEKTGLICNPAFNQREGLALNMVASGPGSVLNMLEAEADEAPEAVIKEALVKAQEEISSLNQQLQKIIKEVGTVKENVVLHESDPKLKSAAKEFLRDKLDSVIYTVDKNDREDNVSALSAELIEYLQSQNFTGEDLAEAKQILEEEIDITVHNNVLEKDRRPDGRALDEVRPLEVYVDILPRPHGSALFMRGKTHVLSVVTLGSPGDVLLLQGMEVSGEKRFLHHYNFPAYSSGEIAPLRSPGRREIGHGALGEKAILPMIPSQEDFPYTIRVVSEILSSNGSTSMAATCASSLALMAGGVPIKKHVAGIAMGLMTDSSRYKILTDIQGPEDHYGDMDFKVAGTRDGVNALQMDLKIEGVDAKMLAEALDQAQKARFFILDKMESVIAKPRENLSPFAPRIFTIQIKPDQIGNLIGPGGKNINKIIEDTGATVDINDDGSVFVTAPDEEKAQAAIARIKETTKEFLAGEIVEGKVIEIRDFGAIISLGGRKEGLLHISELAPRHVARVEDVVHLGDVLKLKVKKVEPNGKISLSLKDAQRHD